jgi:hypothetical protein
MGGLRKSPGLPFSIGNGSIFIYIYTVYIYGKRNGCYFSKCAHLCLQNWTIKRINTSYCMYIIAICKIIEGGEFIANRHKKGLHLMLNMFTITGIDA